MHQLWTLIWKSVRIRQRSLTSTLLDLFAPLAVIIGYLVFKIFVIGYTFESTDTLTYARDSDLFRATGNRIDFANDLPKYICTEILYDHRQLGPGTSYGARMGGVSGSSKGELQRLISLPDPASQRRITRKTTTRRPIARRTTTPKETTTTTTTISITDPSTISNSNSSSTTTATTTTTTTATTTTTTTTTPPATRRPGGRGKKSRSGSNEIGSDFFPSSSTASSEQERVSGRLFKDEIESFCGVKLVSPSETKSKSVKDRLDHVLNIRKRHRGGRLSRNQVKPQSNGCYRLNNETLHQVGIELIGFHAPEAGSNGTILLDFTLYMTDSLTNNVIHMPYELTYLYREYNYPYGTLASGHGHIESCLIGAVASIYRRQNLDISLPNKREMVRYHSMGPLEGGQFTGLEGNLTRPIQGYRVSNTKSQFKVSHLPEKLTWSIRADPIWADPQQILILFMILSILAYTINGLFVLIRISDDIEMGVYQYLRMSGVSAMAYWSSHFITTMTHLILESFIISVILSIPMSNQLLFDPIYELSFAIKFYLLCSWSCVFTLQTLAAGCFFSKTTHAVVIFGLLYASANFYPLLFATTWGPACITNFFTLTLLLVISNPVYCLLLVVISGITMKTGEPFDWRHIAEILPNSGMFQFSVLQLWIIQVFQALFWASIIALKDRHMLSTDKFVPALTSCLCECLCCWSCLFDSGVTPMNDKPASKVDKVSPDRRVACSLRHVSLDGVQLRVANMDRLGALFRDKSESEIEKRNFAAMAYLAAHKQAGSPPAGGAPAQAAARVSQASGLSSKVLDQTQLRMPMVCDMTLSWHNKMIGLADISVDFSYNQISYIIGAVQYKELLFATILGYRTPDSGKVIIDGREFPYEVRDKFRRQIGYLGERDIFFANMSSFENLQFFGSIRDPNYRTYDSESNYVLSLLHLTGRKDSSPEVLTARSQRKLSLAVAIVGHTKLLLLVEPTLGLRWKPRCQVLNLLRKYKTIRSILIDTSDIDEAVTCGDKIVLVRNDKIEFDEAPNKLKEQLKCGYRIRFSPGASRKVNLAALEHYLGSLFGQDKMGSLEKWTNSLTDDHQTPSLASNESSANKSARVHKSARLANSKINFARDSLMLSVRPSSHCIKALQSVMGKFVVDPSGEGLTAPGSKSTSASKQQQQQSQTNESATFGVKITLIDFESIEDIIVARISYQNYPELPPELLASLSANKKSNRRESHSKVYPATTPIDFSFNPLTIMRDRFSGPENRHIALLSLILPLILAGSYMYVANVSHSRHSESPLGPYAVTDLYNGRIGFYAYDSMNITSPNELATELVQLWPGQEQIKRVLYHDFRRINNDTYIIEESLKRSKTLLVSSIYFDVATGQTTVLYGSGLPYSLLGAIRKFGQFWLALTSGLLAQQLAGESGTRYNSSQSLRDSYRGDFVEFKHEWHEILNGIITRRFYYGVGFGLAEGIAIGSMVLTPSRHRLEARVISVRINYWVAIGTCDLFLSSLLNLGYLTLFVLIEGISNTRTIMIAFAMLTLYKLSVLPVAYLTSLVIGRRWLGFMFIVLVSIVLNWDFGIVINTFVDYTLVYRGVEYQTVKWLVNIFPINALMHTLTTIAHLEMINKLCRKVPIYITLDGVHSIDPKSGAREPDRLSLVGYSLQKVEECLANGKESVNMEVVHGKELGILWDIYILAVFAIVVWLFLLVSEQAFGLAARRASSRDRESERLRSTNRSHSPSSGKYRWLKEKGRLISEYSKCMNERRYVSLMMKNCFFVRIWFKPMAEKRMIDKCQDLVISPLVEGGQPKEEIKIELQTTLQMFIRVGNAAKMHKLNRSQLLDEYSKLLQRYNDTLNGFAIVDWSREMLYKLLLHGHYNAKSSNS